MTGQTISHYRGSSSGKMQAEGIAGFRHIAKRLHPEDVGLFPNRVFKRMSLPQSLNCRIESEVSIRTFQRRLVCEYGEEAGETTLMSAV